MSLRIRTNVASLKARKQLQSTGHQLQKSSTSLSSGKRINRAADDAAGLSISENLRVATRSLIKAKRNTGDGISLIQSAEGGLIETTNMLTRLRELAIQSASDTIGSSERKALDLELRLYLW